LICAENGRDPLRAVDAILQRDHPGVGSNGPHSLEYRCPKEGQLLENS
jgi:hypothetical protein